MKDKKPLVLFTRYVLYAEKLVPVLKIPPLMFVVGPKNKLITVIIHVSWDQYIFVVVVASVGVPVKDYLVYIVIYSIKVVFLMDFGCNATLVRSLGEVWTIQSMYQYLDCLTITIPGKDFPNIDWHIAILPGTKKNYLNTDPYIKSWAQLLRAIKYLLGRSGSSPR